MQGDVGPYTFRFEGIQCIRPSSGVYGAESVGWAASIVGLAFGAATGTYIGSGVLVFSGGNVGAAAGVGALTAVEAAIATEAIAQAARAAVGGIGSTLPDQVYLKVNGKKIWPKRFDNVNMNRGTYCAVDFEVPLGDGQFTLSIHEHDILFPDDTLYSLEVPWDATYARLPILLTPGSEQDSNAEGSVYVLWLTLTREKGSREMVNDEHQKRLEKDPKTGKLTELPGLAFYRMEMPTQGFWTGEPEFVDFISRFATNGWRRRCYYATISVVEAGGKIYAMGRGGRGLELFNVFDGNWDRLWLERRFKDPNWRTKEYYKTIQSAIVGDKLHILGRGSKGVEIYKWDDEIGKLSDNLATNTRFKDPNWKQPKYFDTIQTINHDGTLYLLGRASDGVIMYRWSPDLNSWSDRMSINKRFKDPNWEKPEYYCTIQTVSAGGILYLLGRGSNGMEIYEWRSPNWTKNLATCGAFRDSSWREAKYYQTIHTAVVDGKLYLIGRDKKGIQIHTFDRVLGAWRELIGAGEWEIFNDASGGKRKDSNRTLQSAVIGGKIYIFCRTQEGVEIYGFNPDTAERSDRLGVCKAFADPIGKDSDVYMTIGTLATPDALYLYGRIPSRV